MLRLHGIVPACLAIGHGQPDLGETFGKIPSQLTFHRALPCEGITIAKDGQMQFRINRALLPGLFLDYLWADLAFVELVTATFS